MKARPFPLRLAAHNMATTARKRAVEEIEAPLCTASRHDSNKRTKLSPSAEEGSDSSAPSSCSVSEDSALRSTPPASDETRNSSFSSLETSDVDDSESSLSDSSEDASDPESELEDEDDEAVITIGGPKKPQMKRDGLLSSAQELNARLSALLPQLAAANEELGKDGQNYCMEDVEEGEEHIEMDLGLGVLEQKADGDESSDDEDESDGEEEAAQVGDVPVSSRTGKKEQERETSVMTKLLGQPKGRQKQKVGIEEVG
jgi:hypothetical protein